MDTKSYCGCCGNESNGEDWCERCLPHISKDTSLPPWKRIYYGQNNYQDCPYQMPETNVVNSFARRVIMAAPQPDDWTLVTLECGHQSEVLLLHALHGDALRPVRECFC